MRIDPWRSAAIVPVFLYVVVAALWTFSGATAGVAVGFFLTALALPAAAVLGRRALPFAPAGILAGMVGLLWFIDGSPPTGAIGDVAAGLLLASPLAFLAAVWVTEDLPGTSVALAVIGLADGVGLLAASRSLSASVNGPAGLLAAIGAVASQQGIAIGVLLRGGVPTSIPLSATPDAVFVLLGILAMVGILLSLLRGPGAEWIRPPTEPVLPRHPLGSPVPRPVASPELAGILASASRPELPEFPSYAGLYPVLAAAAAAGGFLTIAEYRPSYALLAVAVGVALVVAYLWRVGSGPPSRPRRRRAGRSPPAPAQAPATRSAPARRA